MRLFGNWNHLPRDEYWRDVYVATRILRHVLPKGRCDREEIAIAGSAALHWYQEKHRIGQNGKTQGTLMFL